MMEIGRKHILVVEDNPDVRRVAVAQLSHLGHAVIEAENGEAALELLKSGLAVDLVFSDMVMPGSINGPRLAELARQLRPGIRLLLTSGSALSTAQGHPEIPAGVEFLGKPYRRSDLAEKLRAVFAA